MTGHVSEHAVCSYVVLGMVKVGWTDRVRDEVLHRVKEDRNILHTVKRRKATWLSHILCVNCLLKQVME